MYHTRTCVLTRYFWPPGWGLGLPPSKEQLEDAQLLTVPMGVLSLRRESERRTHTRFSYYIAIGVTIIWQG